MAIYCEKECNGIGSLVTHMCPYPVQGSNVVDKAVQSGIKELQEYLEGMYVDSISTRAQVMKCYFILKTVLLYHTVFVQLFVALLLNVL